MHLTAHLLTCAGQRGCAGGLRAHGLAFLPQIHRAPPEPGDPVGSTGRGHLRLLRDGRAGPGTHFLLLEDDIR